MDDTTITKLSVARISKGGRSLDLAATTDTGLVWTMRLRLEAGHGDTAVPAIISALADLIANSQRWRDHSVRLNTVSWQIYEALGVIPPDADRHEGDLVDDLPRVCELVRAGIDAETVAAWKDAD